MADHARASRTRRLGTCDVFSAFVEANAEKVRALFDRVAESDPAKALDLFARLAEFALLVPGRPESPALLQAGDFLKRCHIQASIHSFAGFTFYPAPEKF